MSARDPVMAGRPIDVCRALLDALDATEGRRRRRKRNTSADAIGIGMKRELLENALRDDPDPDEFEGWLLERCFERGPGEGAWRAMALEIFSEWRMAQAAPSFRAWLEAGAPSDDRSEGRRARSGDAARSDDAARPARPGLPILPLLAGLALAGLGACGDGPDYDDVPDIEVAGMEVEERQRAGMTRPVLEPMLAGAGPDSTIYDSPVDLARPPDATHWPPPTGTHRARATAAPARRGPGGGT